MLCEILRYISANPDWRVGHLGGLPPPFSRQHLRPKPLTPPGPPLEPPGPPTRHPWTPGPPLHPPLILAFSYFVPFFALIAPNAPAPMDPPLEDNPGSPGPPGRGSGPAPALWMRLL